MREHQGEGEDGVEGGEGFEDGVEEELWVGLGRERGEEEAMGEGGMGRERGGEEREDEVGGERRVVDEASGDEVGVELVGLVVGFEFGEGREMERERERGGMRAGYEEHFLLDCVSEVRSSNSLSIYS